MLSREQLLKGIVYPLAVKTTQVLDLAHKKISSICTDTDKDTTCATVSGKSFVCAHDWHVTAYEIAYVFGCIYVDIGLCISLLFIPSISHDTSSFETIVGRLFEGRNAAALIRTLVEENIFSDQFCELLCIFLSDFADLRHGWITCAFPPARRKGAKRHRK